MVTLGFFGFFAARAFAFAMVQSRKRRTPQSITVTLHDSYAAPGDPDKAVFAN
jgi:hypothetical protein